MREIVIDDLEEVEVDSDVEIVNHKKSIQPVELDLQDRVFPIVKSDYGESPAQPVEVVDVG